MINEIEKKIIDDLSFNVTPTYTSTGTEKQEFIQILKKLENQNLIYVQWIEDGMFKGENGDIILLEKGKQMSANPD